MKQFAPYNKSIETKAGNKVLVNDFAHVQDMNQNIDAAKKVADELGKDIYIRHHIDGIKDYKNPEYGIGTPNMLGDLKTFDIKNNNSIDTFFVNSLKDCSKKKCKYAVCDITLATKEDIDAMLVRRLYGSLGTNRYKTIEQVVVINGNKVAEISRKQIAKLDFTDLLKFI